MSIWCSLETIGWEDEGAGAAEHGIYVGVIDENGEREPRPHWSLGEVRAYAEGWSNHYPTEDVDPPASVDLATIPTWCVPGHADDEDYDAFGPWIRLSVNCPAAPSYWKKDKQGNPKRKDRSATVVLDEVAARALVAQLTDWLAIAKVHPVTEAARS